MEEVGRDTDNREEVEREYESDDENEMVVDEFEGRENVSDDADEEDDRLVGDIEREMEEVGRDTGNREDVEMENKSDDENEIVVYE